MVLIPVAGIRHDHEIDPQLGRVKAVTDVSVIASDDSSVTVQFTEVDDGAGGLVDYEVYVREAGQTEFTLQAVDTGTTVGATKSIKAELLDPGRTFEITVKAKLDVAIRSFQSNVVTQATGASSPAQPTALITTSVAIGQVNLSCTDNGGTGFSWERRTPPGDPDDPATGGTWAEIATTGDGVNTFNDVFAFVIGTDYEWRVFATDAGPTKSAPSNTISATPVEETPTDPGDVVLSFVSKTENSVTVKVDSESDDGTGSPSNYAARFWKSADANPSWGFHNTTEFVTSGVSIGAALNIPVNGLDASVEYQIQTIPFRGTLNVDAVFGSLSNVITQTTNAGSTPPLAPSGLSVVVDSTQQVTHSWTDNASDETSQSIEERNETDGGAFAEIENVAAGIVTKVHDRGSAYPSNKRFQAQVIAEKSGSSDSDPSNTVLYTPNPVTGDFPNEPSGFTKVFEHDCKVIPSGTNGILGTWGNRQTSGNFTVVTDNDAPRSGPDVLDFRIKAGFPAGNVPSKFFFLGDFPGFLVGQGYEEFYCSHIVKLVGSDYETPPANQKFFYLKRGNKNDSPFMGLRSTSTGSIVPDFPLKWSFRNNPRFSSGRDFKVGQWHHIELYLKHSTVDVADGVLKVWLDGALQISDNTYLTRVSTDSSGIGGWNDYEFTPVYGGTGYTKTREDHLRLDHIYGSGKGIV